jgi:hypothetical protein
VSNVQKIQFYPQKSTETMINFFVTSWNSPGMKTWVKQLFTEMRILQIQGVSVGTVSQFLNQLKSPPDSHKCNSTIAFLYYLTKHLSLGADDDTGGEGKTIIQSPLLPAYAMLLLSLDFIYKSRNPIVREKKWALLCELFNPEAESNNHLLHIFLAKCLNGKVPDNSHPGLFNYLNKFFKTDPSNSNPEGLSNQIKHSTTASTSAAGGQLTRAPAKAGAKSGAKANAKADAKAGAKADAKADAKAGAKADAKAGAKVGAKADAKAGAKADAKAGTKVGAKVGAKAGTKAGAKADAKAGTIAGAKADAKAKAGGHNMRTTHHATAMGYLEMMTTAQHKAGGKNSKQQAASPVKKTGPGNNPGNFTPRSSPRTLAAKRKLPKNQNEKDDKKIRLNK